MRVLHVLQELRASGAEAMLETAAPLWRDHDVECDVLSIGSTEGPYGTSLRAAGYGVLHLPFTRDARFLRGYYRLLRSRAYDVVHVHAEQASFYLCLAARLAGAAVVRTTHNSFPYEGWLRRRRAWQRRAARAAGTVYVAIGDTVARNERERLLNPTQRIDNWVDIERFTPPSPRVRQAARRELNLGEGDVVVVTVGNCSPVKNHASLLRALASIDDVSWVWVHVGEEEAERAELGLAIDLGVEELCRFLGRTDPLPALHAADLYAMPSLYEGLPISLLEALSTGLPAVLTDVPGNRDLAGITERMTWSSVDPGQLQVALRAALADSADGLGDKARSNQHDGIADRYSPAVGVAAYASLYRSLAGR